MFKQGFEKVATKITSRAYAKAIRNSKNGLARAEKYLDRADQRLLRYVAQHDKSRYLKSMDLTSVRDRAIKKIKGGS